MEEIKLPETFNDGGFQMRLIEREGDFAIYSQSRGDRVITFEAVRIGHAKDRKSPKGSIIKARETYPKPSQWGHSAFSCTTIERARERLEEMRSRFHKSQEKNSGCSDMDPEIS